jgi:hypothetical protein
MTPSGRNKRTHFNFMIGESIERLETREILLQAAAQITLARYAVSSAERAQALARLDAAGEAIDALRSRDNQLRLW